MSKFVDDFKHTAKQDIRIFFLPFVGAYEEVKAELKHPPASTAFKDIAIKDMRVFFAPFVGAFNAWKRELTKK